MISRLAVAAALAVGVPIPSLAQDTSHAEADRPVADSAGPIITPEGVGAALQLDPAVQLEIAPHVGAIDAQLRRMVGLHRRHAADPSETERHRLHDEMETVHNEMTQHHDALRASLTPEQRKAFMHYVHERAEAAGLKMTHMGRHSGKHEGGTPHR